MTPLDATTDAAWIGAAPTSSAPTERTASPRVVPRDLPRTEIVRAATLAPSPDNNQPWRFRFEGQTLLLEHDAARALPSDVERMFDLQGLGAAIENACIAASRLGFAGNVHYSAGGAESAVARIEFQPGAAPDPLGPYLAERRTSRRGYRRRSVSEETLRRLRDEARAAAPQVQVDWLSQRSQIRRLAALVAAGDRIRFEYREFHAELFRQLRFTAQAAERTRDGLDLRLLALPPGGSWALGMLRSWSVMKLLNRVGASRLLAAPSALAVWQSGAIAVLSVPAAEPAEFLAAGRALERLWLAATREGLCVHPLGSLPILLRRCELSRTLRAAPQKCGDAPLSPAHRRLSDRIALHLGEMLPETASRTVTMLLRLGYGRSEAIQSLRRPSQEVLD